MGDPSSRIPGTLTTVELLDRIREEFGLTLSRECIRAWARRPTNPLPVAYQGKPGQPHLWDWVAFLSWYDTENEGQDQAPTAGPLAIDDMDWHTARTVSARENAKRDQILTARLAGTHGEIKAMELAAEDRARTAVLTLMAIPPRISARLTTMTDELEIEQLLDAEIRSACQAIEAAARAALGTDDTPAAPQVSEPRP